MHKQNQIYGKTIKGLTLQTKYQMTKVTNIVQITDQIANVKSSKDSSDYKGIIALGNCLSSTYFLAH